MLSFRATLSGRHCPGRDAHSAPLERTAGTPPRLASQPGACPWAPRIRNPAADRTAARLPAILPHDTPRPQAHAVTQDFWSFCLSRLEQELPQQQFNTWIKTLRAEPGEGGWALVAPNRFELQWVRKLYLSNVKLYMNIQNLFTITKYSGYDPEVGSLWGDALKNGIDYNRYPSPRIYTFGINVSF